MEDLKGWFRPSDRLPEKSYTRKFLVIVKSENMDCMCPYQIMLAEWGSFADTGDAFSCWGKSYIDSYPYNFARSIPMERILYWRPLPEVPDDVKNMVWD